jgi:hypothetical protein
MVGVGSREGGKWEIWVTVGVKLASRKEKHSCSFLPDADAERVVAVVAVHLNQVLDFGMREPLSPIRRQRV